MKWVFDWLREQIKEKSVQGFDGNGNPVNVRFVASIMAEDIITEAEAKWEAEVCEWKVLHEKCFIQNPHTKRLFSNEESMQNVYCNTCGKPIKISEVE